MRGGIRHAPSTLRVLRRCGSGSARDRPRRRVHRWYAGHGQRRGQPAVRVHNVGTGHQLSEHRGRAVSGCESHRSGERGGDVAAGSLLGRRGEGLRRRSELRWRSHLHSVHDPRPHEVLGRDHLRAGERSVAIVLSGRNSIRDVARRDEAPDRSQQPQWHGREPIDGRRADVGRSHFRDQRHRSHEVQ